MSPGLRQGRRCTGRTGAGATALLLRNPPQEVPKPTWVIEHSITAQHPRPRQGPLGYSKSGSRFRPRTPVTATGIAQLTDRLSTSCPEEPLCTDCIPLRSFILRSKMQLLARTPPLALLTAVPESSPTGPDRIRGPGMTEPASLPASPARRVEPAPELTHHSASARPRRFDLLAQSGTSTAPRCQAAGYISEQLAKTAGGLFSGEKRLRIGRTLSRRVRAGPPWNATEGNGS